jgi:hypothetical protein
VPYPKTNDKRLEQRNQNFLQKGTEFETYVVRRFDPEYFTLIEWRSDKSVDDIFPLMSKFPDLEFYFESNSESKYFAIECKWRETFTKERIYLDGFQVENYRHYQSVTGNLTFVVLGVGNIPSNPNQVYTIPLDEIETDVLHEFEIDIYRRDNPKDNFFLNCRSGILR